MSVLSAQRYGYGALRFRLKVRPLSTLKARQ